MRSTKTSHVDGVPEDPERRIFDPRRRQAEPPRDEEHHQEPEPLGRHRVEREPAPEAALVGPRAASPRADDADEDAEDDREDRPERDHRHGVLERRPELMGDRLLRPQRLPHVPVGEILEVELVLLPLGLVEPQLLALVLLERLRALAAAQRRDRVARERAEEDEVERDRDEDRQRSEEHALPDVVEAPHPSSFASLPPSRP